MNKRIRTHLLRLSALALTCVGLMSAATAYGMTTMERLFDDEEVRQSDEFTRTFYYTDGSHRDLNTSFTDSLSYELTHSATAGYYILYIHNGTNFRGAYAYSPAECYYEKDDSGRIFVNGVFMSPLYMNFSNNANIAFKSTSDVQGYGVNMFATQCVIEEGVTSIPSYAFNQNPNGKCNIIRWHIPDSVTYISSPDEVGFNALTNFVCSKGSFADDFASCNGYAVTYIDRDISKSNFDISASTAYLSGEEAIPTLTVKGNVETSYWSGSAKVESHRDVTLQEGIDYVVSYSNNTKAGTGTAVIEGIGTYYGKKEISFNIYYKKPTLSSVSNLSAGVKITWKAPEGVASTDKYRVYRKTSGGSFTKLADTSSLSYTDTTAKSGTSYTYTVRVISSTGKTLSNYNTTGKTIRRLSTPTNLKASNTSDGVKVSWSAVTGAQGYYVYRSKDGGDTYSRIKTTGDLSIVDSYANVSGKKYYYRVYAYKTVGETTYKSSYTSKYYFYMSRPAISSITGSTAGKITVKWDAVTKASGYEVRYGTTSAFTDGTYKTSTISSGTTVSKTLSSLTSGKRYYVKVRSFYTTTTGTKYYSAWSGYRSLTAK